MYKMKRQKGITLVALIITIVILLILAVVAITSITNDSIIEYANNAVTGYENKQDNENLKLDEYEGFIDNYKPGGNGGTAIGDATVGTKVTTLSTINGQAYNENNPVIPAGFIPINVPETELTRETSWDAANLAEEVKKGLVITDSVDSNGVSNGNEFVWIPVSNINNMVMCMECGADEILDQTTLQCPTCGTNTKLAGKLYATDTGESFDHDLTGQTYGLNTGLREPDVVTKASGEDSTTGSSYDAVEGNLSIVLEGEYAAEEPEAANFKLQLEDEFTKMAKSVAKYKGFYVGRYETSMPGTTAQSTLGADPMNNINWYNMYKNSKTYSKNNTSLGVVSEMIWGCQYDQVMQLILTNSEDASRVTDTTNVSHDLSAPYKTGGTNYTGSVTYADIASNIYDLEGNVREWTQEASDTSSRVTRGGYYYYSNSPSSRRSDDPGFSVSGYGSRLSLYVAL